MMHDIGPTQPETFEVFEGEEEETFGFEAGDAFEGLETGFQTEEVSSPFNETDEMALAAELLEVTSEEELNYFLGNLIKKAASAARTLVKSPIGKALGGALKQVARKALPMAGTALGAAFGGPVGGMIGRGLASAAGKALGLEYEGLSGEDREFAGARQFVRLAGAATRRAATSGSGISPQVAAQRAVQAAARVYIPGLVGPGIPAAGGAVPAMLPRTGRWFRRGRKIILVGI